MRGSCLCGNIEFELDGDRFKLYQCHCSLCRKQGGSTSNTATVVPKDKFRWLRGTESIRSWTKPTGFRSDFCGTCGSPVPNPLRKLPCYWVPAGLLDDTGTLEVVAHFCVASRPAWDTAPLQGRCYDELPQRFSEFLALLKNEDG